MARSRLGHGFGSSIALPLMLDDTRCLGALNIYATETDAFDEEEVQLLTQLANDLAYGMRALRDRAARETAEQALQQTTAKLQHLLEASPTILYTMRYGDGTPLPGTISANVTRILGYSPDEASQPDWWLTTCTLRTLPQPRKQAGAWWTRGRMR